MLKKAKESCHFIADTYTTLALHWPHQRVKYEPLKTVIKPTITLCK